MSEPDRKSGKHRISRVTTRSGDDGNTSLADGSRLGKGSEHIEAIGDVDELNCFVGHLIVVLRGTRDDLAVAAEEVQQALFDLGAALAVPGSDNYPDADVLDTWIREGNAQLAPLREFVLPGGSEAASRAHLCRSVCRRAERSLWRLGNAYAPGGRYLNRLSDLFFVWARILNAAGPEKQWRGRTDS